MRVSVSMLVAELFLDKVEIAFIRRLNAKILAVRANYAYNVCN